MKAALQVAAFIIKLTLMFDVVFNKISIQVNASLEMKRVCYCTAEAKNLLVATGPRVLFRTLQGSKKWIQAQKIRHCLKCQLLFYCFCFFLSLSVCLSLFLKYLMIPRHCLPFSIYHLVRRRRRCHYLRPLQYSGRARIVSRKNSFQCIKHKDSRRE